MSVPAYIPDKDELRSKLSLHYVCAKLGIQLQADDHANCPFHQDSRPSFYLFDGDDGIQRWWCQPCGEGGDLFDLIRRMTGCSFPEAMVTAAEYLAELPPGYEPPARPQHIRPTAEDWGHEVEEARQRAASPGHEGILSVRSGIVPASDPKLAYRWDTYLRGTWGVGINERGTVHIPHWDAQGHLEGCKLRFGDGRKESLPGSRYLHLYGSWLGRRHKASLITEGESDAWYAGWLAADERVPLDVFAMPSGAQQPIEMSWLSYLRGAQIIYLALDPDTHGVEATRRWVEELNNAGFTDVRVCCLPLGRDLRDAKPVLKDLLHRARKPLNPPGDLQAAPGGFIRQANNGNWFPVSTWTVDPNAQLAGGDDPGFDATLFSRGTESPVVIRLADLANPSALNKWANKQGEIFTGSDTDLKRIAERVKARGSITPEVFQTDRVGLHPAPGTYHYAGPSIVLPTGYIGQMPWRYAPTGRSADVTDRIYLPTTGPFPWRALSAFLALSSPEVMHPILSWAVASARRPEIREFPLLFIGGSSGVGKSTIARLAIRLLGSNIEMDLGANTPFILYRTLASSSSLPVFIDEWTRLSRVDTREAFQSIVPLLYTGGIAERGMADLNTMGYRVSAPTIVAGEDTFSLDRELERTVRVRPTRDAQNKKALAFIHSLPIERFGQALHEWLTTDPALPPFVVTSPDRVAYNREVLSVGWETLRAFLDYCAANSEPVPDIPDVPDLSCFEYDKDDPDENVYITALAEAMALSDQNGIPVVWDDPRGTFVRFVALVGLMETRRLDIQLPGRSRAMRDYFGERYGRLVESTTTPPLGTKRVRAHLIPDLHLTTEGGINDDADDGNGITAP